MAEFATISTGRQEAPQSDGFAVHWLRPASLPPGAGLLLRILRDPNELCGLSPRAWDDLIPVAKFTGLLPQIAARVRRLGKEALIPAPARPHLQSADISAAAHESNMRWEINRLQAALAELPCPIILLKGIAFLLSDFAFAEGRYFQDVDILIPKPWLVPVETALRKRGWVSSENRPLHERYFRTWLQEIAPMWHHERQVQVDIHHSIIPPKDRIPLDASLLYSEAIALGDGSLRVLAPADMFLHAASNTFRTGEFTYLLRDLWDMDGMLEQFTQQPGFWDRVLERAPMLHLTRPFFYAMRYLRLVCETPVPASIEAAAARWRPNTIAVRMADALVQRTLFPRSLDHVDAVREWALVLREYWPPPRLRTILSPLFWRKRLPGISLNAKAGTPDFP